MNTDAIYKISSPEAWQEARSAGQFEGSADDIRDGFIHMSTVEQVAGTLARHFSDHGDLVIAAVDPAALAASLRWERSRGGALFPHIYGVLPMAAVTAEYVVARTADGRHVLPKRNHSDMNPVRKRLFDLVRPALFALEPEKAHEWTLRALEAGRYPRATAIDTSRLGVRIWGLDFPNPVGVAAGFDKDARVPDAILGLGCGFAEIGTVTPLPQTGNPKPRLYRLPQDHAVINRLGFNNGGHAAALERLQDRRPNGIVGVNIGANKDAADRVGDYVMGLERFAGVASYFTVNISSPNTPGLRDLQAPAALDELLSRVMAARADVTATGALPRPVIVKIAPDIAEDDIPAIAERLMAHKVDGIAVSNTTLARPATLRDQPQSRQAGGLSGRPLFRRSTAMLARIYDATNGTIPLIGIGGIDSPERALAKIEAGASLLQLYTGLVFQGPGLIGRIKAHLAAAAEAANATSIVELAGRRAASWAAMPLDE